MNKIKMTCKRCGDSGTVIEDGSTHKSGICPPCQMKDLVGCDVVSIDSVTFEKGE